MADKIKAYKELKWVLTEHGKQRLTEILTNPEDRIRIKCIHIGEDGTGTLKERESQNELNSPITYVDASGVITKDIRVYEKGISEELDNTVYFKALIEESMSGFEICEMALFEEIGDELYMFAVGMGEPINKPALDKGYIISIDYTLYIESSNLLEAYERIELDPSNEFIKKEEIDGLYQSVLFIEGNLAEQISNNTHILGLGRAQQLDDLINSSMNILSGNSVASYYSNVASSVESIKNILGFWSFNYTDAYDNKQNIKDMSGHGLNLSSNKKIVTYEKDYLGLLTALNFTSNDYFYVQEVPLVTCNSSRIELGELIDHELVGSMYYDGINDVWRMRGVQYPENTEYDPITHEIIRKGVRDLFVKYYLPANQANTDSETITLGAIQNHEGQPTAFAPHTWTCSIEDQNIKWTSETGVEYYEDEFKVNIIQYTGTPEAEDKINMLLDNVHPLANDTLTFTGEQFDLLEYNWQPKIDGSGDYELVHHDHPFTFMAVLKHNSNDEENILLAQSDYYHIKAGHNFEFVKTVNNAIEVRLFTDKNNYAIFRTPDYVVPNDLYNIIITFNPGAPIPKQRVYVYINGFRYNVDFIEVGDYDGMQPNILPTTSFVYKTNGDGVIERANNINAKVALVCLIKELLTEEQLRCNALMLNSLCGKNVYYRV